MADMMKKVPVREQDAKERACNFEEVCLGYNADEAVAEAQRCLNWHLYLLQDLISPIMPSLFLFY